VATLLDFANKEFGKRPHQGAYVADYIYESEHAVPLMMIHKSKGWVYFLTNPVVDAEFKLR
jgi:hypothetical protein